MIKARYGNGAFIIENEHSMMVVLDSDGKPCAYQVKKYHSPYGYALTASTFNRLCELFDKYNKE